ncbi:ligase-associated DNA damage response endonuclease PdeM [Ruegeria sediminis]|uniref:Ligase-associated DNA damage response endonuclease PdeM n=1 Tax=Ruegeria sediminis TaxID=2583820 RepID=A0ABY2WYL8_9RHOB|nr:ligase-associated DNA damage response endonuclease PdeM [Ruegeria sediminis]TMV07701.1 ligase-associated DNA damage response endonuclease PdeM [Ruegeria sediminis]
MNGYEFSFSGQRLSALASGALFWPDQRLLCVSDLHLGKSERTARRGGPALPPYENRDTLNRLADDLDHTKAHTVICLGDSFDDLGAAESLTEAERLQVSTLQAGRRWIWIEGNHDPGPVELGGTHLAAWTCDALTFRHIALPQARSEISGHYHPKATLRTSGRSITRPAFLVDRSRVILPAYGTYTGGLRSSDQVLKGVMGPGAMAILTGRHPCCIPMPR